MIFIVLRYDKPNADKLRDELKSEHRQFLASLGNKLLTGGAIFDNTGNIIGGCIIFQSDDPGSAAAIADKDPYAQHPDIAKSTSIIPYRIHWKDGDFFDGMGYAVKTP